VRVFKSVVLSILKHIIKCSNVRGSANEHRGRKRRSCRPMAFSQKTKEKRDFELYDREDFMALQEFKKTTDGMKVIVKEQLR